jgi:asparagine synthase (glutamine-hydrolysing)
LDHELLEFAASIPDSLKIHGSTQKYIFKKAVEDLLPRQIVYRKKMGFPTPLRTWLRRPGSAAIYESLLSRSSFISSIVDRSLIEQLVQRNLDNVEDGTERIWRLLNLELWAGLFITGTAERKPVKPTETISAAKRTD